MLRTLAQSPEAIARGGTRLAKKAQEEGWYPLLVVLGAIALLAIFIALVRWSRNR
jgi:hypothetical protein